jgi:hypothetical protein
MARLLIYRLSSSPDQRYGTTATGKISVVQKGDREMFSKSKQRVFIPMMLVGLLCFGAVAAQAGEYRSGDRVAKDAAIGAAVGTFVQILSGRTQGHQILKGAIAGGALGAAVGAARESQRDRYYRDGYYDRNGYYYNQDGYYSQDGYYYNQNGYYNPDGYSYRNDVNYRDGYYRDGYATRDRIYYRDSNQDYRYDRRTSRRDSRCEHR